jgi:hypothetical protein
MLNVGAVPARKVETQSLWGGHFSLNASLGYQDAKHTEINQYAQATTGPYLPTTPKLKISVGPDVHTKLPNGATIRLGGQYTHTSTNLTHQLCPGSTAWMRDRDIMRVARAQGCQPFSRVSVNMPEVSCLVVRKAVEGRRFSV